MRLLEWPSVADPEDDETCIYCEAMPDERHQPPCPLYAPCFDDLMWCDNCGCEFTTVCFCGEREDR